jgi:hypothetical protein
VDITREEIPYTREKKPQILPTELPEIITQKEMLVRGLTNYYVILTYY